MNYENEGMPLIYWLDETEAENSSLIGGKNSSLARMIRNLKKKGICVPMGFATSASAYKKFIDENELYEKIKEDLESYHSGEYSLGETGKKIRQKIKRGKWPDSIEEELRSSFQKLKKDSKKKNFSVAVRSSATAEDLPDASFAGQLDTYLNISDEEDFLNKCKDCFASLFTDRAISYREEKGFDHLEISLSVGVQEMIRSDLSCSGVMFSIDTDSGFPRVVLINGAWGLGEYVVQGSIDPDEYLVFKPLLFEKSKKPIISKTCGSKEKKLVYGEEGKTKNKKTTKEERRQYVLTDEEVLQLAKWAVEIEKHYARPMDIEWAKDADDGELYIVQARPETVHSLKADMPFLNYTLKDSGKCLLKGISIGDAIATGKAIVMKSPKDILDFKEDAILVTKMTSPDWVPLMRMASAIVTEHGGRTSHAAIVSRELGIPAVIGAESATTKLKNGMEITVSCAEGDVGKVYEGVLKFKTESVDPTELPSVNTRMMLNIANPSGAFRWWRLPIAGIGLARIEFIINNSVKVHPLALIHPEKVKSKKTQKSIDDLTQSSKNKKEYFVSQLALGIGKLAALSYPAPAIVRFSDFKTNEYHDLLGGEAFEDVEENPMLGFRGASRYYSDHYREAFVLECQAIKRTREQMGFDNIIPMIPFVRTPEEAEKVLEVMKQNGLKRGDKGLEVYMMSELPSNVLLAAEFAKQFDGFSIGSNDLTQLLLGVDRDSTVLKDLFDERHRVVKFAIAEIIREAHEAGIKVGICGQAPSDYPDFVEFLISQEIDSISLNPDSFLKTLKHVGEIEQKSIGKTGKPSWQQLLH